MLVSKKLTLLLAISLAAVPAFGCASLAGDDEGGDGETEPVGETNDELRSAVSCQERSDTAYQSGSPLPIQVIHIGGKPTTRATGHAFLKMQAAANSAGVNLSLTSGFRTQAEQKHLYYCYTSGSCNNGNIAAKPGFSNHQNGHALDLSTSSWLAQNASKFGFVRTVAKEAWHYEYRGKDPGGPCARGTSTSAQPGSDTPPDPNGGSADTTDAPTTASPAAGGLTWIAPAQDATLKNGFTVKSRAKNPAVVKVVYAQGTFEFGTSIQAKDDFALDYTFKYTGEKTLTAKGYDANGMLVAEDHVDFTLLP